MGVVFQDHSGNIVKLGAQRIKQGNTNEAEAYASWLTTRCAWNMGIQKLHLEGVH